MNRKQHNILILVLGSLTAIGPFSIDMYLPGFPAIAQDLRTDISHVALTLTSYFIGISIGQLAYGPLLDRYGRKKPLIAGMFIYIVAAIGCSLAPTVEALVVLRFLLAIGSCVGIVAARAIVRDLFPLNEIARIFSTLMLILGVSPIIAPTVGAYVAAVWSWRIIFVILAAIAALILLVVVRYLPESRAGDTSLSLHPFKIVREYAGIMKNPTFIAYGFASAAASGGLFAYISDAPFVFMNLFGFSEQQFAWVFGLSACGVIGASQVNRFVLRKRGSREIALVAATAQTVVSALFVAGVLAGVPPWAVMLMIFGYLVGQGFLGPNTTAIAIEPFTRNAGTASALMGSMQMAAGAIGSSLVSVFHTGTAMPMAGMLLLSAVVSLGMQAGSRVGEKRAVRIL
ncbi:MAG: multidrug effflux MFS transporter [Bacteroidetes bacterium]|nr:multidrug effflux MFS transporter [Bacteroidota bacterium]MCW5896925.1 multidrug effflux MFS transporter [Bacteroidota bacterium]